MDTWMIVALVVVVALVAAAALALVLRSSRERKVEALREQAGRDRDEAQRRHADADRQEADAERHAAKAKVEAAMADSQALEARQARREASEHERRADEVDPDSVITSDSDSDSDSVTTSDDTAQASETLFRNNVQEVDLRREDGEVDLRDGKVDGVSRDQSADLPDVDHHTLAERIQAGEWSGRPRP
ncbi:MAG: hypothetical protein ABIP03_02585 [Aquihabitans sp.]